MGKTLLKTGLAVATAAVAGTLAGRPDPEWYQRLRKPPWHPPAPAFAMVWTPLYVTIAYAAARALDGSPPARRRSFARTLGMNLALNAAWTPLFFRLRAPWAALAEIIALNASNVTLLRRAWQADRPAGLLLVPYTAWTAFATVLTSEIIRRNPDRGRAAERKRSPRCVFR